MLEPGCHNPHILFSILFVHEIPVKVIQPSLRPPLCNLYEPPRTCQNCVLSTPEIKIYQESLGSANYHAQPKCFSNKKRRPALPIPNQVVLHDFTQSTEVYRQKISMSVLSICACHFSNHWERGSVFFISYYKGSLKQLRRKVGWVQKETV